MQIIIPFKQTGRKTDIYLFCVSGQEHRIAPAGFYVAVASCTVETQSDDNKQIFEELRPAFNLLGKVEENFFWVSQREVK